MNNYYTFIGESVTAHFNAHLENQQREANLKIKNQYYCHTCYSPSDNPSNEIANFFNWIHEHGAISGSAITEQLFEDILIEDFNNPETNIQQKVI